MILFIHINNLNFIFTKYNRNLYKIRKNFLIYLTSLFSFRPINERIYTSTVKLKVRNITESRQKFLRNRCISR